LSILTNLGGLATHPKGKAYTKKVYFLLEVKVTHIHHMLRVV